MTTLFFTCAPKSTFIVLWRDEFNEINKYDNLDDYLNIILPQVDIQNTENFNYLAIHVMVIQVYLKSWQNYVSLFATE